MKMVNGVKFGHIFIAFLSLVSKHFMISGSEVSFVMKMINRVEFGYILIAFFSLASKHFMISGFMD